MGGLKRHAQTLARIGPHRAGSGCLYLKSLDGIDRSALADLILVSVADLRANATGGSTGAERAGRPAGASGGVKKAARRRGY
jgi:hypothetical protein